MEHNMMIINNLSERTKYSNILSFVKNISFVLFLSIANVSFSVGNSLMAPDSTMLVLRDEPCTVTNVSPPPNAIICKGEDHLLTASGAAEYVWKIGNDTIGTGESISVSPEDTTIYTLSVAQCVYEVSGATMSDVAVGDIITTDGFIVKPIDWACANYSSKTPSGIVYKIEGNNIWIVATTVGNEPMITGEISGEIMCISSNGCVNTSQITNEDNFPAFAYCINYNIGGLEWCLPSTTDFNAICLNLNDINNTLFLLKGLYYDDITLWSSYLTYGEGDIMGNYYQLENNTFTRIRIYSDTALRETRQVLPISQVEISSLQKMSFSRCYDSFTTIVNVIPSPEIEITGTAGICENSTTTLEVTSGYSSYQWYHNGIALAGETNTTITVNNIGNFSVEVTRSDNGCSSWDSVNVIRFSSDTLRYDTLVCTNSSWPFTWHDVVFETREDTLRTTTEPDINGCSAFVYLYVSIVKQEKTTYIYSLCEGFDFTDSTSTGFYVRYDSMSSDPSINLPYTYPSIGNNPRTFTYTREEPNTNPLGGCPIIIYDLELTINPIIKITRRDSICIGEEYYSEFIDTTFTPDHITNSNPIIINKIFITGECRERRTLVLDVNPVYDTILYSNTCQLPSSFSIGLFQNIDINFGGIPILEDTTIFLQETFETSKGCDSTVGLFLTVYPSYKEYFGNCIEVFDTTCQNNDTLFRPNKYPEFGIIDVSIDSLQLTSDTTLIFSMLKRTRHGCDSLVKLFLTVMPTFNDTLDNVIHVTDSICQSSVLSASPKYPRFYDIDVSIADTVLIIDSLFTSSYGCDSAVTLHLSVLPAYNLGLNNKIVVHEETCQSIDLFTSTLYPNFSGINVAIDSMLITSDTTLYIDSIFRTINDCDSAVTFVLTVHPAYDSLLNNYTILYDTTFQSTSLYNPLNTPFENLDVNENGDYIYDSILVTHSGCDSLVQLNLHVMQVYGIYLYDTTCQSINLYNSLYPDFSEIDVQEIGMITIDTTHQSIIGTDSMVSYNLLVVPSYNVDLASVIHVYDTVCQSISSYYSDLNPLFNGINIVTIGEFIIDSMFKTVHDCDSNVVLHLSVLPTYNLLLNNRIEIFDTVCQSEIPYFYHESRFSNIDISEVSSSSDTTIIIDSIFQTIHGCDSSVRLTLLVHPTYHYNLNNVIHVHDTTCQSATLYTSMYPRFNGIDVSIDNRQLSNDTTFVIDSMFRTIHDCDSNVVLHLVIHPAFNSALDNIINVYDTVCQNISGYYSELNSLFNGVNIDSVGIFIYDSTFLSIYGCDSNVVLTLNVVPTYDTLFDNNTIIYDTTFQSSMPYIVGGFDNIDVSLHGNIFIDSVFQTINGCDSLVLLYLFVKEVFGVIINDTTCQSINLYNSLYPDFSEIDVQEIGMITIDTTYQSIIGTDSMVSYNLLVVPSYNIDLASVIHIYDTVCQSISSYYSESNPLFNGINIETIGDFIIDSMFKTVYDCDSNVVLHLSVLPTYNSLLDNRIEIFDTVCQSEIPYFYPESRFSNIDISEGSLFGDTTMIIDSIFQTIHGCDSSVRLTLLVHPTYHYNLNNVIHVYDTTCQSAALYTSIYPRFNGIDVSIDNRQLSNDTIFTIDSMFKTIHDCDSNVILHLMIHPAFNSALDNIINVYDTICQDPNNLYTSYKYPIFENIDISTYGPITIDTMLLSEHHCDSAIRLNLLVKYSEQWTVDSSICQGDCIEFDGQTITETGIYHGYYVSLTGNGCDLILYIDLTVNEVYETYEVETACDSFLWNGRMFSESQIYQLDTLSFLECDSTAFLDITIFPSYQLFDTIRIVDTALPFTYRDTLFDVGTNSGDYFLSYTTMNGCDSTIDLHLTIAPFYETTIFDTTCQSIHPYTSIVNSDFSNIDVSIANVIIIDSTYLSASHHDSLVHLNLTIFPAYDSLLHNTIVVYDTTCQTTVLYQSIEYPSFSNIDVSEEGMIIIDSVFQTINDCDSSVQLYLTVCPSYMIEEEHTICENDSFEWHDSLLSNLSSNVYIIYDSISTIENCDSIYRLTLTVLPAYFMEEEYEMCHNQTYTWHDSIISDYSVGRYTIYDSLRTDDQCDSVWALHLIVHPTFYEETHVSINFDQEFEWRDHHFDNMEELFYIVTDSLTSSFGCDSVYRLFLTINTPYYFEETDTICDNEILLWHNQTIENLSAGEHLIHDSLLTVVGLDSVFHLILTVQPSHQTDVYDSICQNESYNKNGFYLTADSILQLTQLSGNLTITCQLDTINSYLCDSIVILHLTVHPIYNTQIQLSVPEGETVDTLQMPFIAEYDTIVVEHNRSVFDCDSIVTLTLIVYPATSNAVFDTVCQSSERYDFDPNFINIDVSESGIKTIINDTLQTSHGADSIVTLLLTVYPVYNDTIHIFHCENEFPYVYNDTITIFGNSDTTLLFSTIHGCDSLITVHFNIQLTSSSELFDSICQNEPYINNGFNLTADSIQNLINTTGNNILTIEYRTSNIVDCDSIIILHLTVTPIVQTEESYIICDNESYEWRDTILSDMEAGQYLIYDTLTAQNGCDSILVLNLNVLPSPIEQIISGGGKYCEGDDGKSIVLEHSEIGVTYQLFRNNLLINTWTGNGESHSFGPFIEVGIYTFQATSSNECVRIFEQEVPIGIMPHPPQRIIYRQQ